MSTYEEILERMRGRLKYPASSAEGSFIGDVLAAVANELAGIHSEDIDTALENAFVETAEGDSLTKLCRNYGVDRHDAEYASAYVTISGTAGAIVSGVCVCAGELIFSVENGQVGENGTVTLLATAVETGDIYNVEAGEINAFLTEYADLTGVENALAASGGVDEETDDELRERTLYKMRNPSAGGNETDYVRWALDVPGVKNAKVIADPPNVNVYIVADNGETASGTLSGEVQEYMESVRPVGAVVSVLAATPVNISLSINADIGDAGAEEVKALMEAAVKDYFNDIALKSGNVSYHKIAELLFVEGVRDIDGYTLNGGTTSVALTDTQYPVLSEVILNA